MDVRQGRNDKVSTAVDDCARRIVLDAIFADHFVDTAIGYHDRCVLERRAIANIKNGHVVQDSVYLERRVLLATGNQEHGEHSEGDPQCFPWKSRHLRA